MNRQKVIGIIIVLCVLIVGGLLALKILQDKEPKQPGTYTTKDDSQLIYNKAREEQANNLLNNKKVLSPNDARIKTYVIRKIEDPVVAKNYVLSYNQNNDSFEVVVKTIRINTAKDEATQWLRAQGFSKEAICILPVIFKITKREADSLRGLNIVFDPLPTDCK